MEIGIIKKLPTLKVVHLNEGQLQIWTERSHALIQSKVLIFLIHSSGCSESTRPKTGNSTVESRFKKDFGSKQNLS